MPNLVVPRADLFQALGRQMTDAEFEDLCFEFGIELDEVTSEREIVRRERGEEAAANLPEDTLYKIEIPANRYDLLCVEGLSAALRVFLNISAVPHYVLEEAQESITIEAPTLAVRPFVVCALLQGVTFDQQRFKSFIDLQDKLHANICRKRTLVAVGTHDYDTLKGPFRYTALPPNEIRFKALNQTQELTATELMELYQKDLKLKHFLHIIQDQPCYPVILDSRGVVLSMPPIINGDHSRITLNTKNVLVECTATDLTKARIVLNVITATFSQYCTQPFHIQTVRVIDSKGRTHITPVAEERAVRVASKYLSSVVGAQISAEQSASLLSRMCLPSVAEGEEIVVRVPMTRPDVLHPCDIAEDVAIAYGYNNIVKVIPRVATTGKQQPINHMSDLMRQEVAQAGFSEVLTFVLQSLRENYTLMRKQPDNKAVVIDNPRSVDFEVPRTSLLPGLLRTLANNKAQELPVRLFELSDVVHAAPELPSRTRNVRLLSAVYCNQAADFEVVHGLLDVALGKLGLAHKKDYVLRRSADESFFPGFQAEVVVRERVVGILGIIHPEVLANFDLQYPVSALELDFQTLLDYQALLG